MPPGIGSLLKLIGGTPVMGNPAITFIGDTLAVVQKSTAQVKNFASSAVAVVQNQIATVTTELGGAVSAAASSVTTLPELQGISGLVPEGQALVTSLGDMTTKLGSLDTLANNLSGVTVPNPANLTEFSMSDAMGGLENINKLYPEGIPESLGIDTAKLSAPLDMATALGDQKTFIEGIAAGISAAPDPIQAAVDAKALVDTHVATIEAAVTDSQNTHASITAVLDKATQGTAVGDAAVSTVTHVKEFADKVLTTAGRTALGV